MPARGRTQWQNRYAWAVMPGSAAGEPSPGSYRLTGGVTAPCINVRALVRLGAARGRRPRRAPRRGCMLRRSIAADGRAMRTHTCMWWLRGPAAACDACIAGSRRQRRARRRARVRGDAHGGRARRCRTRHHRGMQPAGCCRRCIARARQLLDLAST
jgi:hypothetical protein